MAGNQPIKIHGKTYEYVRELGSGAFGEVHLAKDQRSGKEFAIKSIDLSQFDDPSFAYREAERLKDLSHSNIIKFYGADTNVSYKLVMLLEYARNGSVHDYLKDEGRFPEHVAKNKFCHMLKGVNYLHSKGIAHRDLKPANILFGDNWNIKIADFGLAKAIKISVYKESVFGPAARRMYTQCGTPGFWAPEVEASSNMEGYDGFKADMFSMGRVLDVMLSCKSNAPIPQDCQNIISNLTEREPAKRNSAKKLLDNEFSAPVYSLPLVHNGRGHWQ